MQYLVLSIASTVILFGMSLLVWADEGTSPSQEVTQNLGGTTDDSAQETMFDQGQPSLEGKARKEQLRAEIRAKRERVRAEMQAKRDLLRAEGEEIKNEIRAKRAKVHVHAKGAAEAVAQPAR